MNEFLSICLHESGHAIVALSLGAPVSRLAVAVRGDDKVAGETCCRLPAGDVHRTISVLMGGINATNLFGHFSFIMPAEPIDKVVKAGKPRRKPIAIGVDSDDILGLGRDGGLIIATLNGRLDSDKVFSMADQLSRRALSANDRAVYLLTTRLAQRGALLARDIADLARQVVKVEI